MKRLLAIAALAALPAFGFKSAEWQETRTLFLREAERLAKVYARCEAHVAEPAENLSVPIESFPDGSVKTGIVAAKAQLFLAENLVWGADVKVRQYRPDGTVVSEIDAERVVVDRATRAGWAKGPVKASLRGEASLSGKDVYLNFPERYLAIARDAVVGNASNEVRAATAAYDGGESVIYLDGDVRARQAKSADEVYEISADRAYVFLEGTNDVRRVVAMDHVAFASGTRSGACDRLDYRRKEGVVTLYGRDGGCATLSDSGKRKGTLSGSRITFWPDAEQVEVLNSTITVDADSMKASRKALR